ncbi:CF298-like protein [Mya arenaria]|uniref:CF298-like protein n=1 Tax=Mya arenaria TaxID=6604 RepID=A0ABY7EFV5_MYAAR|nr:CF298-like protein [Mya arenaria]
MVRLVIKKGDEAQFLYETTVDTKIDDLAEHGITLPPNMQGLTDEQIHDLKLKDEWAEKCTPQGGVVVNEDKVGRRNGQAPTEKMAEKKVAANEMVTQKTVQEALDIMRGAVTIVYPMGLPPHENIKMEFENNEDLSGTQASKDIIEEAEASLWFSGKEMMRGRPIKDFVGRNEKTKVIAKLQKKGQGCPSREPVVGEEEQKQMMAYYYRKQEEMKKLEKEAEDSHLDSAWADNNALKRNFHGLKDIKWGPRNFLE